MKDFVQVKTSELTGAALDWAVQMVVWGLKGHVREDNKEALREGAISVSKEKAYSTSWSSTGPLLDEYGIEFKWVTDATIEAYSYTLSENRSMGGDHREAACRLIAMELGETVMVPSILVK